MKRIVFVASLVMAVIFLVSQTGANCGGKSQAGFAIITDIHLGREGIDTHQKLQAAVEAIIKAKVEFNICGVVVLGDITDKGQKSDFVAARDILNGLHKVNLPYITLIGNHDTWEYTMIKGANPDDRTKIATIADAATADQYFEEVFWGSGNQKNIQLIKSLFGSSWQRSQNPINDLENVAHPVYLQNCGFAYGGITFVALDFSPRADPAVDLQHANTPSARPGDKRGSLTSLHKQTIEFSLSYTKRYQLAKKTIILFSHQPVVDTLMGGGLVYLPKEAYLMTKPELYYNIYLFAGHAHANVGIGRQILTEDVAGIDLTNGISRTGNSIRIVKIGSDGSVDYSTLLSIGYNFASSTPVSTVAPTPTSSPIPTPTLSPTPTPTYRYTPTPTEISERQRVKDSLYRWQEKNQYALSSFASFGFPLLFKLIEEKDYVILGNEAWAITSAMPGEGFVLYNSQISSDNWVIKWKCGYSDSIAPRGLVVKDRKTVYVRIGMYNQMIYTEDGGETWKSDLGLIPELLNR